MHETAPNPGSRRGNVVLALAALVVSGALIGDAIHRSHKGNEASFSVIKDGPCFISTDNAGFPVAKGEGVEALALHTDGVDSHGSKAKCLSAVMSRIVTINHLLLANDYSADAAVFQNETYKVPVFATTHHSYDGTDLKVVKTVQH